MVNPKHSLLLGAFRASALLLVALDNNAFAQTSSAPATDPNGPMDATTNRPPDERQADIGDIIVTAQKREQKLNDVGLTITALSAASLANRQVASLSDIANLVPSLSYSNTAYGNPVYTLRGIGFNDSSLASYPTVSVYLDEVPLPFPALIKHSAFDLQRIEVLKGPQGTLFGQNATGGAINYIAAKPTSDFEAGGSLGYGRFNEVNGEAYVSGPISDTLTTRLSGRVERADGWQMSNSRSGERLGKVRNYMGRLLLDFKPSDRLHLVLNVNGWVDKSEPQALQLVAKVPQAPLPPAVAALPFSPLDPRAADWTPGIPFADNQFWQASIRGDYDLNDAVTLTSITSYAHYRQREGDDGDGTPTRILDTPQNNGLIKTFAQELRLSNGSGDRLKWVVGANYENSVANQTINVDYRDTSAAASLVPFGYVIRQQLTSSNQRIRNYAGFANIEYDILPIVTAKAGVRYTKSKRYSESCSATDSTELGSFIYDVVLQGAFGPYVAGNCYSVNFDPVTVGGVSPFSPGQFVGDLNEHNVSWHAGLDLRPRPGLLIYGNVSKGYKAGSFPIVGATKISQYLPVRQESVLAYEAGFKVSLIDRTLQLNGAAFYYDYTDKQLRAKFNDLIFGILDIVTNVPKSTVKGFELEMTATPTRGLVINTAFTYLDAKIKRYIGNNVSGAVQNLAGSDIPFTPKYQVAVNSDYEFPISDQLNAFAGGSVNFRSATTAAVGGSQNPTSPGAVGQVPLFYKIDDYALVDVRAGIAKADGSLRLSVWGKNIFNTYYFNNVYAAFDVIGRYTGKPATYGATLAFKFR